MNIDLDRLETIAKAATQGAWSADGPANPAPDDNLTVGPDTGEGFNPDTGKGVIAYVQPSWDDATHIATFNPPTVLALIARIRELENTHEEPEDRPFIATIERPSNF